MPSEGTRIAYIGESENIAQRIKDHDARKAWWEYAVLVTAQANGLHKAHVKYLESRLVEIASTISAVELENKTIPPRSSLNEAAQSNMEAFLDNIRLILPALGIRAFQESVRKVITVRMPSVEEFTEPETTEFVLNNSRRGTEARAVLKGADFIIHRGSFAQATWNGADKHTYQRLHENLTKRGVLKPAGNNLAEFTEDYAFKSPSAAAAVVNGRQANGRKEWKHADSDMTFAEWEEQRLSAV